MKVRIVFIMMFMCLGNLQAQSDATLEETINWINEHSIPNQIPDSSDKIPSIKNLGYDRNTKEIRLIQYRGSDRNDYRYDYMHHPEFYDGLRLYKFDRGYILDFLRKDGYATSFLFYWGDKDIALRSLKAFEHLFNLLDHDIKVDNELVEKNTF